MATEIVVDNSAGGDAEFAAEVCRALSARGFAVELRKLFGRSLKLRSVSSGGCNGCELELNALAGIER